MNYVWQKNFREKQEVNLAEAGLKSVNHRNEGYKLLT